MLLTFTGHARRSLRCPVPRVSYPTETHSVLLTILSRARSLSQTKQSHAVALLNGFLPQSVSLCGSLVLRYAMFGDRKTYRFLFRQTVPFARSAFLWNTIFRAQSVSRVSDNFESYNRMVRSGVRPDDHTFPFVIKACADYLEVKKGLEVHAVVFKLGFDLDVFVGNTLVLFYGNCGILGDARKVFDEMVERDVVSWNTVIGVYSGNGCHADAVRIFHEMNLRFGFRLNMVTVVSMLPVCAALEDDAMARQIHCYVVKAGLGFQVTVGNSLVDVYGKCGNVGDSRRVFEEIFERNEVSWNAIITGFAYLGKNSDALKMFRSMIDEGLAPNSVTISTILPVLVELGLFSLGKEVHGFSLRFGMEFDIFVSNSLIDMYAKSGYSTKASHVFYQMGEKNVVSWNSMVANYAQNSLELEAIKLVRQMQDDGKIPNTITFTNVLPACARVGFVRPGKEIHARAIRTGCFFDPFVSNALTDMYAKCGCLHLAQNLFNISLKDEVSYNIMIVGYSQTADCSKSLDLFLEMELLGMQRDVVSYMGVISACANLAAIKQGKEVHGLVIRKHMHMHLFIANSLLDLYNRCGRIDVASKIFERIPSKDRASWNSMILGYGLLGDWAIAVDLFGEMKEDGVEYDSVSYIAVLSACSHGGLVEEGKKYFEDMQARNIEPTQMHYACMVDLLGRAGLMEETVKFVKNLPVEPDANVWGALLGACRIHGNIEFAGWAAEHLFKLKPQHCGYYAILSNMYAEAGKWDEANMVRELMKTRGAKKNPGCSWVEIDDQIHAFVAGEKMLSLGRS